VKSYRDAFKAEPDVRAALGYEALRLLAEAIKQADHPYAADKVRDALREVKDFSGVAGPLTVTKEQHVRRPVFAARLGADGPALVKRYAPEALP
jgi:ABC-type branched-subunit amino acid transport system substrate-binding protein